MMGNGSAPPLAICVVSVVFFKQKTAYEITYGDWSSDVCSSDLTCTTGRPVGSHSGRNISVITPWSRGTCSTSRITTPSSPGCTPCQSLVTICGSFCAPGNMFHSFDALPRLHARAWPPPKNGKPSRRLGEQTEETTNGRRLDCVPL